MRDPDPAVEERFLKAMALMRFAEEMRRAGREARSRKGQFAEGAIPEGAIRGNSVSDTSTPELPKTEEFGS